MIEWGARQSGSGYLAWVKEGDCVTDLGWCAGFVAVVDAVQAWCDARLHASS